MKLKKFELHWSATVKGTQIVEAFDEDDAVEQFDSMPNIDDMDDEPINAEFDFVHEVKPKKKKSK